jgi:hypothetical protein
MKKLDLHELTADEALKNFLSEYRHYHKKLEAFKVIHGYGSSGEGGKIMRRIRKVLNDNKDKLKFTYGEDIDSNPGYTIVYPKLAIAQYTDLLAEEILSFCATRKVQEKVLSKFRKHGESQIHQTLKSLEKKKMILSGSKGIYKTWTRI